MNSGSIGLHRPQTDNHPQPALARLQQAIHALTRARRLQLLTGYAWAGLFWGLAGACVAVLILRIYQPSPTYRLLPLVAGIIAAALLLACLIAWRRRPDDLQVAILADVQLRLQQKLSTAWEFARAGSAPALSESLAVQAVQARLPARPERVFPLTVNLWGRLAPIAAGLLLLLWIIELPHFATNEAPAADTVVIEQGVQLREYGRRMQARAQREDLPRSHEQAQSMQRLGSRMESANLSRDQALNRLRQLSNDLERQRQAALRLTADAGHETAIDPGRLRTMPLPPAENAGANLRRLLEDLANGRLQPGDARFSDDAKAALSRHGITPQELEQALKELAEGDGSDLRKLLERLAQSDPDQAQRDAAELDNARQKLQRIRENLGDNATAPVPQNDSSSADPDDSAADADGGSGTYAGEGVDFPGADGDNDAGSGAGYSPGGTQQQPAPFEPGVQRPEGVVLKPQSRIAGDGEIFTSEVSILPNVQAPALETTDIAGEYRTQLEAALSKEEYPLHRKELIRRYFLTLSEGVAVPAAAAAANNQNGETQP